MPTLILEDADLEHWIEGLDIEIRGRGSDDRWPRAQSRPLDAGWFLDEEERNLYRRALLALLDR